MIIRLGWSLVGWSGPGLLGCVILLGRVVLLECIILLGRTFMVTFRSSYICCTVAFCRPSTL